MEKLIDTAGLLYFTLYIYPYLKTIATKRLIELNDKDKAICVACFTIIYHCISTMLNYPINMPLINLLIFCYVMMESFIM